MREKGDGKGLMWWVSLAVLLAGYVGAYYATVEPSVDIALVMHPGFSKEMLARAPKFPGYSLRNSWFTNEEVGRFFSPFHWLDRRIRPHVWEL